jgi:hypothetical protein
MLLEGSIGVASIVGSQMTGLTSVMPMKWVFTLATTLCTALVVYGYFYPETVDPALRAKPFSWRRSHVFGAFAYCCFTRSARRALDADAMVLYRKRVDLYYGVSLDPEMELPMDSAELEGSEALLDAQRDAATAIDAEVESEAYHGLVPVPAPAPASGEGLAAGLLEGDRDSSSSDPIPAASRSYVEACPPRHVPQRNALPMLSISLGLIFMVGVGYRAIQFNFIKQQFDVSGEDYATMLTLSAFVRTAGTLFLVPLVKSMLRMPTHELRAMQGCFLLQGLCMGCYALADRFWHVCALDCLNALLTCITFSYMRVLMANQASSQLQAHILGLIAVVEVLTAVAGSSGRSRAAQV